MARRAVEMARRDHHGSSEPLDHVGFYLIDRGQSELKAAFGYRPLCAERLLDWVRGHAKTVYFGSIMLGLVVLIDTRDRACAGGLGTLVVGSSARRRLYCCRFRKWRLAWSTRC